MGTDMMPFMHKRFGEFIRFLCAGGAGFLATLALTYILTEYAGLWYFASFLFAQVVGWSLIFALNTFMTFREAHRGDFFLRATAFLVAYLGAFILNALIVLMLTEGFGLHYLLSMVAGTAVVVVANFLVSKHIVFAREGMHPFIARAASLAREHAGGFALSLVIAFITIAPHFILWTDPGFRGIEMMMLDAEEHYMARIHEVSEGHLMAGNTFLPDKDKPFATPPLGEMIIALFGKIFGLEAARASIVSKPVSMFIISILIYALAFSLSGSRIAAFTAVSAAILGYTLIGTSPAPLTELLRGNPQGGPFFIYSRLVNPSISAVFLFAALLTAHKTLFAPKGARYLHALALGILIGATIYISPYPFVFLGAFLVCAWTWFLSRGESERARAAFIAGLITLIVTIPFLVNYYALHALSEYEMLARYLGAVERREFVLGMLLPLMVLIVTLAWPRVFPREGRTFFLIACVALFLSLNHQLITGMYLQPGHYHWYITKPLAGVLVGLLIGALFLRIPDFRLRAGTVALILLFFLANSAGIFAPWYQTTHADALATQAYAPLLEYLNSIHPSQSVWANTEISAFIPIYTDHDAPNNVNVGSYPNPASFFEKRLFMEYRLREIAPDEFEEVIRREAHHVGDRLWGLWLRELTGDPAAVPEEEFPRLAALYAEFWKLSWDEVFSALGATLVVARNNEYGAYAAIPVLREKARVGDFVVFERF